MQKFQDETDENGDMDIKLTTQQTHALHQLVTGIRNDNKAEQTLGGYAGTGKTTLIKYLVQFFPSFGICAYTGKAANVLRKKGMSTASTIHSLIYKPYFDNGHVYFELTDDPGCDGFIVDEASMVSKDIYDDLRIFEKPMIFVGDHGQLEPVGSSFNLMQKPQIKLEQIHRNAGPIAHFAQHVRTGYAAKSFRKGGDQVYFVSKRQMTTESLLEADQVICAYNATRVELNNRIRKALKHKGTINEGERVMCLRNNKRMGLFNGMQGTVVRLYEKRNRKYMDFEFDGTVINEVCYDPEQFGKEKSPNNFMGGGSSSTNPFDYAYAITCHKAQGDEWDKVLVLEQKCSKWSHKRWAYTAASRAKQQLEWVFPY